MFVFRRCRRWRQIFVFRVRFCTRRRWCVVQRFTVRCCCRCGVIKFIVGWCVFVVVVVLWRFCRRLWTRLGRTTVCRVRWLSREVTLYRTRTRTVAFVASECRVGNAEVVDGRGAVRVCRSDTLLRVGLDRLENGATVFREELVFTLVLLWRPASGKCRKLLS